MSALMYFPPNTYSSRYGDEFFTLSVVGHEVVGAVEGDCSLPSSCPSVPGLWSGVHVVYKVEVRRGEREPWQVKRRFSECLALADAVRAAQADRSPSAPFDAVAPAKTFFPRVDEDFILERRKLLEEYLDRLCLIASRTPKTGCSKSAVARFLLLED
jgi:hypothetical protein